MFQDRLAINVVLLTCVYFIIIKHIRLGNRMKLIVYNFAQHTFGIYLVHKLIMAFVVLPLMPESFEMHYAIVYPLMISLEVVV